MIALLQKYCAENGGRIPTITGRSFRLRPTIALCSPTPGHFLRGRMLTIVDCYTFYLRRHVGRRERSIEHYKWLSKFAYRYGKEENLIFVAPDFDWLGIEITKELMEIWPIDRIKNNLPVIGTELQKVVGNWVGVAANSSSREDDVPKGEKWVHHFSKVRFRSVDALNTYDSIG